MSSHPLSEHSCSTALKAYLRPFENAVAPFCVFTPGALRRCSDGEVHDFIAAGPTVEQVADAMTASLLDGQHDFSSYDYFFDLMDCLDDSPRLDEVWRALMDVVVTTRDTLVRHDPGYCDHDLLLACGPTVPFVAMSWGLLLCMIDHASGESRWEESANLELVATTAALATTLLDTAIEAMAESFGSLPRTGATTGATES